MDEPILSTRGAAAPRRAAVRAWRSDGGQILPIVAVCLVGLITFVAIVVDLAIYSNSWEQSQHFARLAALAALEAHFASTGTTEAARASDALTRAREVTGRNFMLSDPSESAQLVSNTSTDAGAKLIAGRYYFGNTCVQGQANSNCDPCPDNYPCFVTADLTNPSEKVTAYRVQGALYDSIGPHFARAVFHANEKFPVNVFATASVRPRHVLVLIDVSGSMMRQTHPYRLPADQKNTPAEGHGVTPLYTPPSINPTVNPPEPQFMEDQWTFLRGLSSQGPRPMRTDLATPGDWTNFLGFPAGNLTETQYQRIHFWDDYRQVVTLQDSDYGSLNPQQQDIFYSPNAKPEWSAPTAYTAFTDVFTHTPTTEATGPYASFGYGGPEPQRTVFIGLKTAVEFFKHRNVAGDKMGILFYNKTISWMSFVRLTSDFDTLSEYTDFGDRSTIGDLAPAPSPDPFAGSVAQRVSSLGAKGLELIVRHRMMPLGTSSFYTNTLGALNAALTELSDNNLDSSATQSLVLIGDGLGNCVTCPSPLPNPLPTEIQICDGAPSEIRCTNTFEVYDRAQRDTLAWAASFLAQRGIALHSIIVGSKVEPHTLRIKKPGSNDCMTDEELRQLDIPFVRGGFEGYGSSSPGVSSCRGACSPTGDPGTCQRCKDAWSNAPAFLESDAYSYELSAGTGGLWGPIRPKSPRCPNYAADCSDAPDFSHWAAAAMEPYDPQCRDEEDQINAYMEKIIGGNPFTLVEVG